MKRKLYLLSSTHWDREWYRPFQAMRYRLAETMDEIIDVLEKNTDFHLFCLDGQTIVLDDYMQAAPENKERLQALISEGRIEIGPWYVMPDTRLVSGESLIANFLEGIKIAGRWKTETWKYGYMCDIFGHIAQMPQILKGFHLNGAYLGRGLWSENWRGFFLWEGADKTVIPTYLGKYFEVSLQITAHMDDADYYDRIRQVVDTSFADCRIPIIVIADAYDHARINVRTNQLIHDIEKLYPDIEVHHESLEKLSEEIKPYLNMLPVVSGELIDTTKCRSRIPRVVGQSISSYYPLKYRNDICQLMIEKLIQPFCAIGRLQGMKYRPALMEKCYDYLLKNQPHDSICGCSADQVHIDMRYRYDQSQAIGTELLNSALQVLREPGYKTGNTIRIFNPFLYKWNAAIRTELPIPVNYEKTFSESAGYEKRNCFRLMALDGKEIPYHIHRIRHDVTFAITGQNQQHCDVYDISFEACLDPFSENALEVIPENMPVRFENKNLINGSYFTQNEFIRMEILPNGSLKITDLETGEVYSGLNTFQDDGEIGNGWFHDTPIDNHVRYATAPLRIERICDGPVNAIWLIEQGILLPESDKSSHQVMLKIVTQVTVWAGQRYVQIDVTVDNPAADHRLTLCCPTGIAADEYMSGQAFCFVKRKSGLNPDRINWDEEDVIPKSMNGIQFVRDSNTKHGFAFVSPYGLHEAGVDQYGNMFITMLRSFSRAYLVDRPETSKLIGTHQYRYAFMAMNSETAEADLVRLQEQLGINLPVEWNKTIPERKKPFLKLDSEDLAVSIIKVPENTDNGDLIIRLWNTKDHDSIGTLFSGFDLERVEQISLDELERHPIKTDDNQIHIQTKPYEIITLCLTLKKEQYR